MNFTDEVDATLSLIEFTQLPSSIPQRRTYDCDTVLEAVEQGDKLIREFNIDGYFVIAEWYDDEDEKQTTIVYQGGKEGYRLNALMRVEKN